MYKVIILLGASFLLIFHSFSQDLLVLKTGTRSIVKIQSFDSSKVWLSLMRNGEIVQTHSSLRDINRIQFDEKNASLSLIDTILLGNQTYLYEDVTKLEGDSLYYAIVGLNGKETRSIAMKEIQSVRINTPIKESNTSNSSFTSDNDNDIDENVSLGLGLGMDHGGFGLNLCVYPIKNIGIFLGGGYAFIGPGFNGGLKFRVFSDRTSPYASVMYGYHAVVKVQNAGQFNKMFYGTTLGLGVDLWINSEKRSYLSLGLLIPFRGSSVQTYVDDLKKNHNIVFKSSLPPVGISFSYRIILG